MHGTDKDDLQQIASDFDFDILGTAVALPTTTNYLCPCQPGPP